MVRRSSGSPAQPGSANRRSRRDGCTWERPAAMRASSPASCVLRPATSRGLAARAAARRRPEPPGLTRRSMPVAASASSRSSGAAAASADLVVSSSVLITPERKPAGGTLPLVARHEPRIRRGSAGTGRLRRNVQESPGGHRWSRGRPAGCRRRGGGHPPDRRGIGGCLRGDPAGDPGAARRQAGARPAHLERPQQRRHLPAGHAAPDRPGRRAGPGRGAGIRTPAGAARHVADRAAARLPARAHALR